LLVFRLRSSPGVNDPDRLIIVAETMAHQDYTKCDAQAQEQESIFIVRMLRVSHEQGAVIEEDALCLLETDSVFPLIGPTLGRAPLEANPCHASIIITL